ncbi:MAG: asparagine synthase C-terminal domain-containing protein [Gammaproteobacteria bacterium]|jgi:asparagine synthase (glutamine-hydrolysing)|nr:asparagine synthase C-terminal domain-containing protein [Gammaproteobacteria bacterium]MBU0770643.1 asparagine synthase C-terminal domain-containing protein [Gammaproteobacteria bacterium]MBU0856215.1 asparagine synthase C-terminal domain-containing protein [Gammaproteobacteria bacterium]MBU1845598.1 asparagine synthase C-terminal domain-containing protein [Gammaproteobacteria bacterium]
MNKICGWLDGARPAAPRVEDVASGLALMAQRLGGLSGSTVQTRLGAGAAVAVRATPGATEVCKDGALLLALAGEPEWSDDALRTRAAHTGMAQSVLHAWRERGPAMLGALQGLFSLALLDGDKGEALLAIDRAGTQELCYALRGTTLVFAANADAVTAHPAVRPDVDPQAIYDYLYSHMVPAPATIYRDVFKLLPAQYVHVRDGTARSGFYWAMPYVDNGPDDYARYAAEFRELLDDSVRNATTSQQVGAFLSGGTDSSTVAGVMAKLSGHGPDTYSIGFDADGFDEMEFARIAASHFGCRPHEYYVTPADVAQAIPKIAAAYDEPFGNASAVPTYFCARMARADGRTLILAGDGGDEIFGGNVRYADQAVFERYGALPSPLRGVLGGVFGHLPDALAVGVLRRARNYVQRARIPLPDRMEVFNHVEREGADRILPAGLLRTINPDRPCAFAREVYGRTDSQAMVNRMMHLDLKQTLADSDLRKVSRMCELADIDVHYPLLDTRLMEFSARLPADYKVRNGQLRWFFKDALKDFLPQATITKSKHGFGLPFGLWMQQDPQLGRVAEQSLDALAQRGVVQPAFVQHLLARHRSEHASYYGVMIWVLMMLEQWLQAHPHARLDT